MKRTTKIIDVFSRDKFDSSTARQELEAYIGLKEDCCCGDNTQQVITGILIDEIKRLREERTYLEYLVEKYLTILQKEQEITKEKTC